MVFAPSVAFRDSYRAFKDENPKIVKPMETFAHRKLAIPAVPLPNGMNDHALKGVLAGYRECHLDGDVLLIYKIERNVVRPLLVCTHSDLKGPRQSDTLRRLQGG